MQRSIAALAFVALGGLTVSYALRLKMYTGEGPGAGLFPLIIGIGLVLAGVLWFFQLRTDPEQGTPIALSAAAALRVVAQVAALLLFSFLLPQVGFVTSAAVLVVLTAFIAGERSWLWMAVVAALCSAGVQQLFRLLGTEL